MIDDDILEECFKFNILNDSVKVGLDELTVLSEDSSNFDKLCDKYDVVKIMTEEFNTLRVKLNTLCASEDLALLYIALSKCLVDEDYVNAERIRNLIITFKI